MAYSTYTTRAIVCGSKDSYTSDRSFLLFTEEAGMLWATARSVRTEGSKQRPALQDFSLIRVSLVRGRTGWRIGSVEARGNPFLAAHSRPARALVAGAIKLLRRYVHGEGSLRSLYADLEMLVTNVPEDTSHTSVLLQLFHLRLLHMLGYIQPTVDIQPLLKADTSVDALERYDAEQEARITGLIEAATTASHL